MVLLILTYFGMRIWLYARFDSIVNEGTYTEFVDNAKSTRSIPENILIAYAKIHGFNSNTSTNQFLTELPFRLLDPKNGTITDCPCVRVNYGLVTNTWDRWTIGLHLDKDVGSLKCLEYQLNNLDFLHGQIGVRNASIHYFDKRIDDLTTLESLQLCLMTKNPDLYNPKTNPERVRNKLREMHLTAPKNHKCSRLSE